jgi:hypothetical protein
MGAVNFDHLKTGREGTLRGVAKVADQLLYFRQRKFLRHGQAAVGARTRSDCLSPGCLLSPAVR